MVPHAQTPRGRFARLPGWAGIFYTGKSSGDQGLPTRLVCYKGGFVGPFWCFGPSQEQEKWAWWAHAQLQGCTLWLRYYTTASGCAAENKEAEALRQVDFASNYLDNGDYRWADMATFLGIPSMNSAAQLGAVTDL